MADRTGLRPAPTRTCVGCRKRDSWSALLRVVSAGAGSGAGSPVTLLPDPRHRLAGRGAWLHPDPACFEMAVRRSAFVRALRLAGPADVRPLAEHLGIGQQPTPRPGGARQ